MTALYYDLLSFSFIALKIFFLKVEESISSKLLLITALRAAGDTLGAPGGLGLSFFPVLNIFDDVKYPQLNPG